MATGKRPDRFVVGYSATGNDIYGFEANCSDLTAYAWMLPMRLAAARAKVKSLIQCDRPVVYELVPVKPRGRKETQRGKKTT